MQPPPRSITQPCPLTPAYIEPQARLSNIEPQIQLADIAPQLPLSDSIASLLRGPSHAAACSISSDAPVLRQSTTSIADSLSRRSTGPDGAFGALPRPPEQCRLPGVSSVQFVDASHAFGDLPRPPEFPSNTASWSADLCHTTTFIYLDDIVTIDFDDLSLVRVTTIPNRHSPYTQKYIDSLNELARGFTDSDDDVPELMDPDDSDADDDVAQAA